MRTRVLPVLAALGAAGCAAMPPETTAVATIATATVQARGETAAVGTADADAADDPAIWRNPADPAASLIVATDKRAGLHVYGLDGRDRSFVAAGRVNNVDLRDMGAAGIVVAASDRSDPAHAMIALYRLDPRNATLAALGRIAVADGEAYGICLARVRGGLQAFNVLKDGRIVQVAIDLAGAGTGAVPAGRVLRTLRLATQSEGCVVDERTDRLYVAEEDVGLWRFDARADGSPAPQRVAAADGAHLVADTEGVALIRRGARDGYLLVSSQGDNAYAVYRLRDDHYVGRFRIGAGRVGATEETDGIDVAAGDFGPGFPGGLFVAQDGRNAPDAQNFKLVAWRDIARALTLR